MNTFKTLMDLKQQVQNEQERILGQMEVLAVENIEQHMRLSERMDVFWKVQEMIGRRIEACLAEAKEEIGQAGGQADA